MLVGRGTSLSCSSLTHTPSCTHTSTPAYLSKQRKDEDIGHLPNWPLLISKTPRAWFSLWTKLPSFTVLPHLQGLGVPGAWRTSIASQFRWCSDITPFKSSWDRLYYWPQFFTLCFRAWPQPHKWTGNCPSPWLWAWLWDWLWKWQHASSESKPRRCEELALAGPWV